MLLQGIIPPLITPLSDRDQLDIAGLERLVQHIIAGGVHGLFILGTSGEGPSLSHRLQRELVERTCQLVGGKVPILVGVTDTSAEESLQLAKFSAEQGADAVVLAAPYYFPMHQDDLVTYCQWFASESPLPVVLYNMPSHSKVDYAVDTVARLAQVEKIIGLKDSSGQVLYFQKLLAIAADRPDFSLLMGPEELMAESVLMGGNGGVCGGANLVPDLYVELYNAAKQQDLLLVHKLQQRVLRLSAKLYGTAPAPTSYLTGIKTALSLAGLCSDRLAEPLYQMSPDLREHISQHMRDLGLRVEPLP